MCIPRLCNEISLSTAKLFFETFKKCYSSDFPCIKSSRNGEKSAFCEYCRCDFTICHDGKYDISRHVKSTKHLECAKLDTLLKKGTYSEVIRVELLFTSLKFKIFFRSLPMPDYNDCYVQRLLRLYYNESGLRQIWNTSNSEQTILNSLVGGPSLFFAPWPLVT